MDIKDLYENWSDLAKLVQAVNNYNQQTNDENIEAIINMMSGANGVNRAKLINEASGNSNTVAMNTIARAMNLDGSSTFGSQLKHVAEVFDNLGISLQAKVQKTGSGCTLQLIPTPINDPNFWTTGRGHELKLEPVEWTLPVDKNGRIIYDGLEKNNVLHAVADTEGNVKLVGAAEMALSNVLEQITYQKNADILRHLRGGTDQQIRDAIRRFKYVTNDMTRAAVNPGSNRSNVNASQLSELTKAFQLNGTPHRQEVTGSTVYLDNLFRSLFKQHYAGQGSFASQELKVDQATRLVGEMGLLMRSLGAKKGLEVIRRNSKFEPILNNESLMLPVLRGLTQIAMMEPVSGPISDTHGLDITYLNGIQRAFESLEKDIKQN